MISNWKLWLCKKQNCLTDNIYGEFDKQDIRFLNWIANIWIPAVFHYFQNIHLPQKSSPNRRISTIHLLIGIHHYYQIVKSWKSFTKNTSELFIHLACAHNCNEQQMTTKESNFIKNTPNVWSPNTTGKNCRHLS